MTTFSTVIANKRIKGLLVTSDLDLCAGGMNLGLESASLSRFCFCGSCLPTGFLMDQSNIDHFDDRKKITGRVYQQMKSCESKSNHQQDEQDHREFLPFAR